MRFLPLAMIALAGCGSSSPAPEPPAAVEGTLELETAAAGAPDAGTRAGHGGDRFAATADAPLLVVRGRVKPATAHVEITGERRRARVNLERDGRFVAVLPGLRPGRNLFEVTGQASGAEPWRTEVLVTRTGGGRAARVTVPAKDNTPPQAILVLRSGGDIVSSISPVREDDEPPLRLIDARLDLEATVRDEDGGTGRVRVSLTYTVECPGEPPRRRTHYFPPSEIARVQIPPGTRAPALRTRRATVTVEAGAGCVARGEAWADTTNASGLESFSDQIAFERRG